MTKELLQQSAQLFDQPEKWNAYLELAAQKENIKNLWFRKLHRELAKYFNNNVEKDWKWDDEDHRYLSWYLTDFGTESLSIGLNNYTNLDLWADDDEFNDEKIIELLHTEKYSPLFSAFSRIDGQFGRDHYIIERGNFVFGSEYDGKFETDKLAWYAGNETEKLAKQIIEKVDRIRKDKNLTALIADLCRETKIEGDTAE